MTASVSSLALSQVLTTRPHSLFNIDCYKSSVESLLSTEEPLY